jgi:2-keto-4-pentenoate hydratase
VHVHHDRTADDAPTAALSDADVDELARTVREARRSGRTLTAPGAGEPLTLADAYRVQARVTAARLADGERRIGWKLGYTSRAMREQMGVDAPNFGPLTDVMLLPDGGRVPACALQPRVEPEIAVVLGETAPQLASSLADLAARAGRAGRDDDGLDDAGLDDAALDEAALDDAALELAAGAVSGVRAALEVVDSVWTGYRFRLEDNTADGSSAAWFVLGPPLPAAGLPDVAVELSSASSGVLTGSGADADGHPLRGLAWLALRLAERDEWFHPGDVVITGGLTGAVPLEGRVVARFTPPSGPTVEVSVLPPR